MYRHGITEFNNLPSTFHNPGRSQQNAARCASQSLSGYSSFNEFRNCLWEWGVYSFEIWFWDQGLFGSPQCLLVCARSSRICIKIKSWVNTQFRNYSWEWGVYRFEIWFWDQGLFRNPQRLFVGRRFSRTRVKIKWNRKRIRILNQANFIVTT